MLHRPITLIDICLKYHKNKYEAVSTMGNFADSDIECLRDLLNKAIELEEKCSELVLKISQGLDKYIVKYIHDKGES
jgi:hypothetical protein